MSNAKKLVVEGIGDYITQLCGDYFIDHYKDPFSNNQHLVTTMESKAVNFFVAPSRKTTNREDITHMALGHVLRFGFRLRAAKSALVALNIIAMEYHHF